MGTLSVHQAMHLPVVVEVCAPAQRPIARDDTWLVPSPWSCDDRIDAQDLYSVDNTDIGLTDVGEPGWLPFATKAIQAAVTLVGSRPSRSARSRVVASPSIAERDKRFNSVWYHESGPGAVADFLA